MLRTGVIVGALALATIPLAGVGTEAAVALDDFPPNLIQSAPTANPLESTRTSSAVFALRSPVYPGYNECNLDFAGWKRCSWFFSTGPLVNGVHTLQVRRMPPGGGVPEQTDSWTWTIGTAQAIATRALCGVRTPIAPARPESPQRAVLWTSVNGFDRDMSANIPFKNPPSSFDKPGIYGRNGFQLMQVLTAPGLPGNVTRVPLFPSGTPATVVPPGGAYSFVAGALPPVNPGEKVGIETITYNNAGSASIAYSRSYLGLVDCLRILPPAGITENPDGTRSATFGWVNSGPIAVRAPLAGGADTWTAATWTAETTPNTLSGPPASAATAPRPTVFPPNASGTWTYTWTPAGASQPNPIVVWQVGDQTASFQAGSAPRIPYGSATNPFTHVDATTTHVWPGAPVQEVRAASPQALPAADTGGAVNTLTRLQVTSRVMPSRNRTVTPGKVIHFTSTLRNVGAVDAVNPRICETIPAGMVFVSAPGREIKGKGRQICWTSARLAAGSAVTGTMTLRARTSARRGSRTNTIRATATNSCTVTTYAEFFVGLNPARTQNAFAPVDWATGATSPLPDAAREQQAGSTAPGIARLKVATRVVRPTRRTVARGATLSIRGSVTNTSSVVARNVRLCERIPVGMTVVKAPFFGRTSARTICWSRPELKGGQTVSGTTVLRASTNAKVGIRANRSTVSAVNACPITSRATFRVRSS